KSMFVWASQDAGRNWLGQRVPAPRFDGQLAADVVVGFLRGTALHTSLFTDSTKMKGGGVALARSTDAGQSFPPAATIVPGDSAHGAADKEWIAADAGPTSPFQGSLYVAWSYNDYAHRYQGRIPSDVSLTVSRDGGASFAPPRRIALDGSFVQLGVRSSGDLDLVWLDDPDARQVLYAAGTEGGGRFSEARPIATTPVGETIISLSFAVQPAGRMLACWSQSPEPGPKGQPARMSVRCSASADGARWESPAPLGGDSTGATLVAFPTVAAASQGWWVLAYESDSSQTRVVLFRSRDGITFQRHLTLARRGFGSARFCPGWHGCRREPLAQPGDYVGLAAAGARLAAAYVLPEGDDPAG